MNIDVELVVSLGTELISADIETLIKMIKTPNLILPVTNQNGIEVEIVIKEEVRTNVITTKIRRLKENNQMTNIGMYL